MRERRKRENIILDISYLLCVCRTEGRILVECLLSFSSWKELRRQWYTSDVLEHSVKVSLSKLSWRPSYHRSYISQRRSSTMDVLRSRCERSVSEPMEDISLCWKFPTFYKKIWIHIIIYIVISCCILPIFLIYLNCHKDTKMFVRSRMYLTIHHIWSRPNP